MASKFVKAALVLVCTVIVIIGAAYVFRAGLTRLTANHFLAEDNIVITRLDVLEVNQSRATASVLELQFGSGQRLSLRDVALGYRFDSLRQAPVVESIDVGSAQLLAATDEVDNDADEESGPLLLSDLLQLLRELPLTAVSVDELMLPQYSKVLALSLQHNGGELVVRIDNADLQFLARFSQADATATAQLDVNLTRGAEPVGNVSVSLQPMQGSYSLSGQGHLEFADLNTLLGELQQAPAAVPLQAASLDLDLAGSVADDFNGTLNGNTTNADSASFVLGVDAGSTFTLPARPEGGLGAVMVALKDRAQFTFTTGADARVSTSKLPIQTSGSWDTKPFSADAVLSLEDCRLTTCGLGFNGTAMFDTYTIAGDIKVDTLESGDDSSKYHVRTNNLVIIGLPSWAPPLDIDAQLQVDAEKIEFSTPLLLRDAPAEAGITAAGIYTIESGEARVHVTIPPVEFTDQGRALSAWLKGWPYSFDALSGSLAAETELTWRPSVSTAEADGAGVITAIVKATATNLGGFYDDIFFRGFNGILEGNIDTGAAFMLETPELAVTLDGVDVGVPIDNVKLNFRFDRAARQLRVASVSSEALGGSVGGNDLLYNFGAERNDLKLVFNGLRIENMMELADYDGVQANGAVSGELPLTLTPTGVQVAAGTLHAEAPGGNIRYLSAVGTQGNPGIDLVNQALANYQFDSLISSIIYSPEGELILAMQLQGTNPQMSKDQRINLNLNLTDNIPALLKSLQAAREIESFLQEQYQ